MTPDYRTVGMGNVKRRARREWNCSMKARWSAALRGNGDFVRKDEGLALRRRTGPGGAARRRGDTAQRQRSYLL